jgi:hypothetical protein
MLCARRQHREATMRIADIPIKYQEYWAQNQSDPTYVRQPPFPPSPTPGAASYDQGFPATNQTIGGIPPFGQDQNGVLRLETRWSQWYQAGAPIIYDATFQGQTTGLGQTTGYPLGARVGSTNVTGRYWTSTVDGNTTNPDAGGAGWLGSQDLVIPATGAQLQFTNATTLTLAPKNGGLLWVNGFNYAVPAALTVSNSGLAASTLYYVYAAVTAGALSIDAPSTTGYALATNGMPQKSGDVTRTLVGMVYTNGSIQFVQQDGSWQVISYFQRALQRTRTRFSANRTTNSATFVELNTEIRNSFLCWAGENVSFMVSGAQQSSASGTPATTAVGFDGTTPEQAMGAVNPPSGATYQTSIGISDIKTGLSEGLHYATLLGASGGGTATWIGGAAAAGNPSASLTVALQG